MTPGFGAAPCLSFLCTLSYNRTRGTISSMLRPLSTFRGFGTSSLFLSFRSLLQGLRGACAVIIRLSFVHLVIKFNLIFWMLAFLYLSILGGIGASNDIIQELVLLLAKRRSQGLHKRGLCPFFFFFTSDKNEQDLFIYLWKTLGNRKLFPCVSIKRLFQMTHSP